MDTSGWPYSTILLKLVTIEANRYAIWLVAAAKEWVLSVPCAIMHICYDIIITTPPVPEHLIKKIITVRLLGQLILYIDIDNNVVLPQKLGAIGCWGLLGSVP